jgi:AbiJ N-terminal domain 3/Protein kinase domain
VITPVTRRDLRELLGGNWSGRLSGAEFLSRLYRLQELPSNDDRYPTMAGDIVQHTEANDDWEPDWIFDDDRLRLDDDEKLLRLLAETVSPEVVSSRTDVDNAVTKINTLLLPDGFELFPAGAMSGRPVFSWRPTVARQPPTGDFPSSLIAGLSQVLTGLTTSTGIDSMFEVEDFPTPTTLANNKEEKVKSWLRAAQADDGFDHWAGLGRVLGPIMDVDKGAFHEEFQKRIRDILAKRGITYLVGGLFTTAPQSAIGGLPATPQLPSDRWTKIGFGGFGVVYRAKDPRLDIDFALKVFEPFPGLTSHTDARARFVREAGLLFRLRHENIVRVYDAGELADGRPYIKMEFFEGLNLQKARELRGFSADESIAIVGKLAAAVEHAHSRSIIHRDIKPSNVLVSEAVDEVRLIDFGLGLLVEEAVARARLTTTAHQFGDAFAAPELLENAKTTDPAVDIYSVGAVWFWLHAGRSPKGAGLEQMIQEFEIDDTLKKLLHTCLLPAAKRPTSPRLVEDLRVGFRKQRAAANRSR